jgi:poly(hydroxyalkanoate) depolymerase family esterase
MNRYCELAIASFSFGLLLAVPAHAASLQLVNRSTWDGGVSLPSYAEMHIYVPDSLADNAAIVVSAHSCGGNPNTQFDAMSQFKTAGDSSGDIILIIPHNPGRNCWDVGSPKALSHDGGGDTHAIAQMVRYALNEYNADSGRVYICGGSSGGMMTQAMVGVYPEMFMAGAARAGVPCGCWGENYDDGQQWSGPCAGGSVSKSAQEWGDYVRSINPDYTGHRPRVQLFHGDRDGTISYNNMGEAIKEWTNVLGLSETPTSEDSVTTSIAQYNRQFWENDCGISVLEAWTAPGKDHSMAYEQEAWIEFFGLDVVGGPDPEATCSGTGGDGAGGAEGSGGATAPGGAGGATGVEGGATGGGAGPTGGGSATGGRSSTGGAPATGGMGGTGGGSSTGPAATGGTTSSGTGGVVGSGGSTVGSGGSSTTGPTSATGGAAAATGGANGLGAASSTTGTESDAGDEGCGCRLGGRTGGSGAATALLAMLGLVLRRRKANG